MKKPIIGVLGGIVSEIMPNKEILPRVASPRAYFKCIEKADGIPILIPVSREENLDAQLDLCDGFVFTGGMDINPAMYGEEPHMNLGVFSLELDIFQYNFVKKVLETDKPFLAICRGYQMLNIVRGGSLYQDLSELGKGRPIQHVQKGVSSEPQHRIVVEKDTILHSIFGDKYSVNSYHHQFIKKLGEGLSVSARAKDGIIEAIELKEKPFAIGVQWHPESMADCDVKMQRLFELLVENSTA